ncbi:monocarboxylate transporter 13-like [Mya arenaria]|uniref:monocarboxylate transporter 13-like n=1 Tax=Mya arenaria TaxID=6604 RepID=UPI0022E58E6E|nr:monocarboxylate transporter 13-like [Mya arenaria]
MSIFGRSERSTDTSERVGLLLDKNAGAKKNGFGEKSKHTPKEAPFGRKAAVMAACLAQQFVCIGMGYGYSVMYAELVIALDVSRSVASLTAAFYFATVNIGGLFFTGLIRKFGPGRSIVVGSFIGSVGLFASGFSPNITGIILLSGVLTGFGMSVCYLAGFIAVSWMFHKNAGLALASLTIGSSVGQFAAPLLYESTIAEYTWRGSFIVLSALPLQCLIAGVLIHCSRDYFVTGAEAQPEDYHDGASSPKQRSVYLSLIFDRLMIIILINFFTLSLTGNVEAWFIVDMLVSRGMTRQAGSVAASAIGLANVVGRLVATITRYKLPNIPTVYHWIYLCPLTAVTHFLIIILPQYSTILALCVLYGIVFGITVAQAPAIMFEATGLSRYPQGMALMNVVYGVGDAISAVVGGYIKDATGTYNIAFYIAGAVCIYNGVTSVLASYYVRERNKMPRHDAGLTVKRETRQRLISSTRIHP